MQSMLTKLWENSGKLLGFALMAIGVVSRVDSISSGLYKWAVPVTEIFKQQKEDKE